MPMYRGVCEKSFVSSPAFCTSAGLLEALVSALWVEYTRVYVDEHTPPWQDRLTDCLYTRSSLCRSTPFFLPLCFSFSSAQRLTAKPRERQYSRLSVVFGLYADCRIVRKLPSSVFYPVPKVPSSHAVCKRLARRLPLSQPCAFPTEKVHVSFSFSSLF